MNASKFGVITPNLNSPRKIVEFAKIAESAGFDHFLLSDHYYFDDSPDMLDSWTLIAHLSGVTSTLRLGTCVTPITFRPPLQFAKIVTTTDQISSGRIIVGVGAGWERSEFEMFSQYYPNKQRYRQFQESLELLVRAWTEDKVIFSGKYYTAKNAVVLPRPVQKPHPPLLFGGWGPSLVKLAGRKGNGWTPTGPRSGEAVKTPRDYARFVRMIEEGLRERGMTRDQFQFGCRFGPLEKAQEYLDEIHAFADVGLNCYQLGANPNKHSGQILKDFGDSVIASL